MRAYFNSFTVEMTLAQANDASHAGQCDKDVNALCETANIRRQFKKISNDQLISELIEYGAWTLEELQNKEENWERLIWIAAGNIIEDK